VTTIRFDCAMGPRHGTLYATNARIGYYYNIILVTQNIIRHRPPPPLTLTKLGDWSAEKKLRNGYLDE